jgi:hypothetical protein
VLKFIGSPGRLGETEHFCHLARRGSIAESPVRVASKSSLQGGQL